jgi:hypothetical protein
VYSGSEAPAQDLRWYSLYQSKRFVTPPRRVTLVSGVLGLTLYEATITPVD